MIRVEEGRGEVHREKGGERRRRTIAKKRVRSEAGITVVQQREGIAGELHIKAARCRTALPSWLGDEVPPYSSQVHNAVSVSCENRPSPPDLGATVNVNPWNWGRQESRKVGMTFVSHSVSQGGTTMETGNRVFSSLAAFQAPLPLQPSRGAAEAGVRAPGS